MIEAPPVSVGAVKATDAVLSEFDVAVTLVGAPGVVAGVIEIDGEDEFEFKAPLFAVAVKV